MNIPELKKAMEVLKEEDWNIIGSFPQKVKDSLQDILSTCQLLCDVSDKMRKKKEYPSYYDSTLQMEMTATRDVAIDGYNLARSEDILWVNKKLMGIEEIIMQDNPYTGYSAKSGYAKKIATAIIQSFGQEKGGI